MTSARYDLVGMDLDELSAVAEDLGESSFRGAQLFSWIYGKGATRFRQMTNLSGSFRERLELAATLDGIILRTTRISQQDGTRKFLFDLRDAGSIESVLIPPALAFSGGTGAREDEQTRLTLCVSTQVGCPLDCQFCATATMGFTRNLTAGEIVSQFLQVRRLTEKPITNVVFMGMGEPLMNYDEVMKSADILSAGMGIAPRRITISTAGWVSGIRRVVEEGRRPKLAVSLHSAIQETRAALMPVARKFPLPDLLSSLEHYYRRLRRRVTYEYIFFDGVNDSEAELRALVKFARRVPCKINVIPYHSIAFTGAGGLRARLAPSRKTEACVELLRREHLTVLVRSSAGEDIEGACGQLAVLQRSPAKRVRPASPSHPQYPDSLIGAPSCD